MLHPMQEFLREEDVVEHDELRAWNVMPERDVECELFYVEVTDRERYVGALESVESLREYDVTPIDDDALYVYACQETREEDELFCRSFAALDLVVVAPIVFTADAGMRISIVGDGENLQTLVESVPDPIDVTVNEIGEYDRRHGALANGLTDRQFEAVRAAVEWGYYDVPGRDRSRTSEKSWTVRRVRPRTTSRRPRARSCDGSWSGARASGDDHVGQRKRDGGRQSAERGALTGGLAKK